MNPLRLCLEGSPRTQAPAGRRSCGAVLRAASGFAPAGVLGRVLRIALALGLLIQGAFVFSGQAAPASAPSADFRQGFEAYAGGAYDQAAEVFREVARRQPSAGAYHNLGNAEWKRGQPGEAILAWEKAQWLDPYDANARVNLRFARQKAQLPSPALAWYEICSTWLPVPAWAVLASISLWLALALVLLPNVLRWRKADWHHALAAASLAVFLLTMPALLGVQTRAQIGVIRAKETVLRLTPTREAQALGRLPAGEMARLERERGQYVYVRTGNDAAGWVERAQFGRITEQ